MEHIKDILEPIIDEIAPKAIPTTYKEITYRSRLEARWAVFLDELNVEYFYEFEGFQLRSGWYVPDFWLPDLCCWLEVKPELPLAGSLAAKFANELCWATHKNVYVTDGAPQEPYQGPSDGMQVDGWSEEMGVWWDGGYGFAECPKCGDVGITFESRGERVCGSRCFSDDVHRIGWTEDLEAARRQCLKTKFW